MKYYKYETPHTGIRYFKVKDNHSDVVQIVYSHKEKVGRAYCIGITLIKYTSFIGNYGWKLDESKYIKEVTAEEYAIAFVETFQKLN